jgi:hypothetical protein
VPPLQAAPDTAVQEKACPAGMRVSGVRAVAAATVAKKQQWVGGFGIVCTAVQHVCDRACEVSYTPSCVRVRTC